MLRLIQRGSRSARLINTFSSKEEFPKFVFGVPRETYPEERRVAASPDSVMLLVKDGHKVLIEQGAGEKVKFNDESYRAQGAEIVQTA
jgi:alanine dehydrogenase